MHMRKVEMGRNGRAIYKAIFQIRNGKWKSALGFRIFKPCWCRMVHLDGDLTQEQPQPG